MNATETACLDTRITHDAIEALALGIVQWLEELVPSGDTTFLFPDNAFADHVTKTSLAAILAQRGITHVRSL